MAIIESEESDQRNDPNQQLEQELSLPQLPFHPHVEQSPLAPSIKNRKLNVSCFDSFYEKIIPALEIYKKVHGHLIVPNNCVLPPSLEEQQQWPVSLWGLHLGAIVKQIRMEKSKRRTMKKTTSLSAHQLTLLDELDFPWDLVAKKFETFVINALQIHKQIHGHVDISQNFIVPCESPWPKYLHGCKFGRVINNIRSRGSYKEQVKMYETQLDQLGFTMKVKERDWQEKILPALQNFYNIHGHTHVFYLLVIPENPKWDKKLWGLKLGSVVHNIRSHGHYEIYVKRDMEKLREIKFCALSDDRFYKVIVPALETYRRKSIEPIPHNFIVPMEKDWPEWSRGFNLGDTVHAIQKVGLFMNNDKKRTILKSLGVFKKEHTKSVVI